MRSTSILATVFLSASFLSAGTIDSVTGPSGTGFFLGGSGADQVLVSSWTQTGSYTNVSISAELGDGSNYGYSGPHAVSVYLTSQIGTGTPVSDTLASTTITPGSADESDSLFTGLSLGAGTYYLVLAAPGQFSEWYGTDTPTVTTDAGVTGDLDSFASNSNTIPDDAFPPASAFTADNTENLLLTVTGDAGSATPEPSSYILAGLAGMFLFSARRRSAR